ncbi:MAG: hypothetical protein JJV88_04455 [Sulfurovum sp.]|nr:hypothetical protein [Sulfurovaceae bacterium]
MKRIAQMVLLISLSLVTLDAKSYKYDDLDRVIEVAYESGEKIYYAYDSAGNMTYVGMDESSNIQEQYHLNDIVVTNPAIVDKIKLAINGLEETKTALDDLASYDGDKLRQEYDGIKHFLDDSKKLLDDVKQSIDNSDEDKEALKKEADKIKSAIDDVKKMIDGYKKDADNSPEAIADINGAIDGVIGMMRSGDVDADEEVVEVGTISIKQGRNTISGNIDISTLPPEVHSVWIVEGGNWYGYSPYPHINDMIEAKYALIEENIVNYKGVLVYAINDGEIEVMVDESDESIEHTYPRGFSIHGTDGAEMSADNMVCDEPYKMVMVAKVSGDEASVFVPEREIEGIDNFVSLGATDGYYVLCDK